MLRPVATERPDAPPPAELRGEAVLVPSPLEPGRRADAADPAFSPAEVQSPELQSRLQALSMAARAVSSEVGTAAAGRFRARQRALREALNANDGSPRATADIAHATVALFRAVAGHRVLGEATASELFALRDGVLREIADRHSLRVDEVGGEIRDVRVPAHAGAAAQRAAELARAVLTETTKAWASRDAGESGHAHLLHWMHALERRAFDERTILPPPPIEVDPDPPRPDHERQIFQDLYWTLDELMQQEDPLDPAFLQDLGRAIRELELAAPGEAQAALARALDIPDDLLHRGVTPVEAPEAPGIEAPRLDRLPRRPPIDTGGLTLPRPHPGRAPGIGAVTVPRPRPLDRSLVAPSVDGLAQPNRALFELIRGAPTGNGPRLNEVLDVYRGASRQVSALAPPFDFETVLPVPFVYTDADGNAFFLPAGSVLRGDNDDGVVAETDGLLIRTGNTLVVANQGELRLGSARDGLLFERLTVATESADVFVEGFQGTIDRDDSVAVLGADRVQVDATQDGRETRVVFEGARVLQTDPNALAIEADRLLYSNDVLSFSGENARIEDRVGADGTHFGMTLDALDLVTASESLQSESVTLRTFQGADGGQEAVFEFTGAQLRTADDDVSLDSAELRFLGSVDGQSRYSLTTGGLSGELAGYDVDAQGLSTLEVALGADGELDSVVLSNPSTVSLSQGDRTLAVTDGRVRAIYDDDGGVVMNVDALKAGLRDGEDLFNVELGRVTLEQAADGAGRMQVTGKSVDGRYGGVDLTGGDVGLEMTLGEGGVAESIFATGRSVTVGDGVSSLIAHEASLQIDLDERQRIAAIQHETGLTELSSSDMGTLTLRGTSTLDLDYRGEQLSTIQADTEDLAWTQPDGSQLDMRGAVATLELDENAAPARATLETGALAWRGTDGVEVTTFGLGGEVAFSPDGGVLETAAGVSGMTIRTNGGIAQIDGGTLVARYAEDGSFEHAAVEAQRAEYFSSGSGTFTIERGTLAIRSLADGGTETAFDAGAIAHQRGAETMSLEDGRLLLVQDTEGNSVLDGSFGAATVNTANAEFALAPGTELHAEIDAEEGLTRLAGDIAQASYRAGADELVLRDATFDGTFVDGELSTFDAEGAVRYEREGGLNLDTDRARVALSPVDDGGSELLVSGDDLRIRDGSREFIGEGTTEVGFLINEAGDVESVRATAERFAIVDGTRRYLFDDTELGIAQDGDVHLINGRMQVFEGDERIGEFRGTDALLDFDDEGLLARAQLLNDDAFLTGDFGTIRATDNRATAWFSDGQLTSVIVSNGAASLELENGLDLDLERSRASLVYDGQGNPTLTVENGRALLNGEFGRLTLPEGFELTARQTEGRTLLAGATPNAVLERDADVLAVNDFTLTMEIGPEGFESLNASGSAHFDHPDRRVRLSNGALAIQYDRAADRMIYAGDVDAVSLVDGDFFMRPQGEGSRVEMGDSFRGNLTGSQFELTLQGDAIESLRFDNASAELEVYDASTRELSSVRFTDQSLLLRRGGDGSTRVDFGFTQSDGRIGATPMGIGGTQFEIDGASAISLHLTEDGRLAEGDGFVATLPGTTRIENRDEGIAATLTGLNAAADPSRIHVALDDGVVMWTEGRVEASGFAFDAGEDRLHLHVAEGSVLHDVRGNFDPATAELYGEVRSLDLTYSTSTEGSELDLQTGDAFLRTGDLQVSVDLTEQHPLSGLGERVRFQSSFDPDGILNRVFLDIPEGGSVEVLQEDLHARLLEQTTELRRNADGSISLDGLGFNIDVHQRRRDVSIDSDVFRATFDPTRGLVFDDVQDARIVIDHADEGEIDMDLLLHRLRDVAYQQFSIRGATTGEAFMLTPTADGSRVDASLRFEYQGIPFRVDAKGASGLEALAAAEVNRFEAYVIDSNHRGQLAFEVDGPEVLPGVDLDLRAEGEGSVRFIGRVVPYDPMRALAGVRRMASTDGAELAGVFRLEPDGVIGIGTFDPDIPIYSSLRLAIPRNANDPWRFGLGAAAQPTVDGAFGLELSLGYQRRLEDGGVFRIAPYVGLNPGSYFDYQFQADTVTLGGISIPRSGAIPTVATTGVDVEWDRWNARLGVHANLPGVAASMGAEDFVADPALGGVHAAIGLELGDRDDPILLEGGVLYDRYRDGSDSVAAGARVTISTDRVFRGLGRLFGN